MTVKHGVIIRLDSLLFIENKKIVKTIIYLLFYSY